jgi:hypothetical protein
MQLPLLTLLTLSLTSLTHGQEWDVVACLDFTGYIPTLAITSNDYNVTATLRSGTNVSTLEPVCSYTGPMNNLLHSNSGVALLGCTAGYSARAFWNNNFSNLLVFQTPTVGTYIGEAPAFPLNFAKSADGLGTVYTGRFGCDGKPDAVPMEINVSGG